MANKGKSRGAVQSTLFDLPGEPDVNGRTIRHKSRKATTFKGGQDRPAHRWFRLTPSYSPDLVATLLSEFGSSKTKVLDPFSGRGTTPIECQLQDVKCTGIEINPLLHFVGRVSLNWDISAATVLEHQREILSKSRKLQRKLKDTPPTEVANELGVGYPQIFNIHRWWREDVLRDLLIIKGSIKHVCHTEELQDLFHLVMANMLLDATSITLGRLQLHFVDRSTDVIDALALFSDAGDVVYKDLVELSDPPRNNTSKIIHGDSTRLRELTGRSKFNLVITSPPYPNRYSYVWNTRPHLYFLDFFETSREAGVLDCTTVGGTWGTATSRHTKGEFEYTDSKVESVLADIVTEIREKDLLMSNYVAMYFDDLYRHILELDKCLSANAVCAYVVGNSRIKKSIVETDLLLLDLFKAVGFDEIRLEQIRKRNSGKELHETTVIVRKN